MTEIQPPASLRRMAGFAMGLFAVQTFWGFTWATLPLYLREFAGSNTVTGIMLSTTGLTGIVLPVVSGMVSDRTSTRWGRRRPIIAAGWALACVALLVMPCVRSLPAILMLLVLAYAGFFTAMGPYFALLADTFRPEERSKATGVMFLVGGTGILSYLLFPARFYEVSPLWPFLWTVGGIILANTVLFSVIHERPGEPVKRSGGIFGEVLKEKEVVRFYTGMVLWWIGLWMVSAFFIIAYREIFGVSTGRAVTAFLIFNISFVVSALPVGLLGIRFGLKKVTACGLGLLAVSLACTPFIGGYDASLPFLVAAGASYSSVLAVSYPFFLRLLPAGNTAGFVGIYMACQNGTLLVGPALGGLVIDLYGYPVLFIASALVILAGLAVFLTVRDAPVKAG